MNQNVAQPVRAFSTSSFGTAQGVSGASYDYAAGGYAAGGPALAVSAVSAVADDSRFGARGGGGEEAQEDQVRSFFPEAFLFSIETLE